MSKPAEIMVIIPDDKTKEEVIEDISDLTEEELAAFEFKEDKGAEDGKSVTFRYETVSPDSVSNDDTSKAFAPSKLFGASFVRHKDKLTKKRNVLKSNPPPTAVAVAKPAK